MPGFTGGYRGNAKSRPIGSHLPDSAGHKKNREHFKKKPSANPVGIA
jgi:hypothetical protein